MTQLPYTGAEFLESLDDGREVICRVSNEQRAAESGSPFDYALSSRFDEIDAIVVLDDVFVPWENMFVYGDLDKANNSFPRTRFHPRAMLHGCTRLAVKLDSSPAC